jgi:hypothetical protein
LEIKLKTFISVKQKIVDKYLFFLPFKWGPEPVPDFVGFFGRPNPSGLFILFK